MMKLLRPGLYRRCNRGCYIKPVLLSSSSYSLLLSSSQSSPLSIVKLVDNPFIEVLEEVPSVMTIVIEVIRSGMVIRLSAVMTIDEEEEEGGVR